jgi:hypothetical protein
MIAKNIPRKQSELTQDAVLFDLLTDAPAPAAQHATLYPLIPLLLGAE